MTSNEKMRIYRRENPWYSRLASLRQRCNNPNNPGYPNYGGREIECRITGKELRALWFRDNASFMKNPSIDRIDNDGHYEYDNCQFIEFSDNSKRAWARFTKEQRSAIQSKRSKKRWSKVSAEDRRKHTAHAESFIKEGGNGKWKTSINTGT